MATIYAKDGIWYLGWIENGAKRAKSLRLKATKQNKRFAEQHKLEKERSLENMPIPYDIKLSEAITQFLSFKRNKEANTVNRYKVSLNRFASFVGDINVNKITENQLIGYELDLNKYSIHTIESYLRDLRTFFAYLRLQNMSGLAVRKEKRYQFKHIVVLQDEKVEEILNYFKSRNIEHYRYLKLLNLTGFRKGEALNLKWENIDFNEKIIKLWNEKDNRNDIFPLFDELESFLLEFKQKQGIDGSIKCSNVRTFGLFAGKVFGFVGSNHIAKILKREFNISFKDFRSTFASNKAKDFKSFELKELLRHKKVTTTEQYYVNIDVRELGNRL